MEKEKDNKLEKDKWENKNSIYKHDEINEEGNKERQ